MEKKAVLVVTHGNFGIELLKSVEMIMGEQEDAQALGLCLGDDVEELREKVDKVIVENENAGKKTIVLVDMFGGSPSNCSLYALSKHNSIKLITGVNILMLIEFFSSRDSEELDDLVEKMISSASEGIQKFQK